MKTYYIEIERQGWTLAVIKVEANSYEEAELKALKALHANDDIGEISEDSAVARLEAGDVDYILDEDGCEIDLEDIEEQEENQVEEKFLVYMVDESGFDSWEEYDSQDEAIAQAVKLYDNDEGGYQEMSVHQLKKEQSIEDISEDNMIWHASHEETLRNK